MHIEGKHNHALYAQLLLDDIKQFYDAERSARLDAGFFAHMDMMRKIAEVWKMFHVILSLPQYLLRSVHPLVAISPGYLLDIIGFNQSSSSSAHRKQGAVRAK